MHKNATARVVVVKLGGRTAQETRALTALARLAATDGVSAVVVHGGGADVDQALAARGVVSARFGGLRATDAHALQITEAVLCGTVNKRVVRFARAAGLDAVGISGEDAGLLTAERAADPRLGFVGTGVACAPRLLHSLLGGGYTPVVAPLALDDAGAHALNVNADHAAASIAVALRAERLFFLTDVAFVRRSAHDPDTAIAALSPGEARDFARICEGGMRPKLEAAAIASGAGVPCLIGDVGAFAGHGTRVGAGAGE